MNLFSRALPRRTKGTPNKTSARHRTAVLTAAVLLATAGGLTAVGNAQAAPVAAGWTTVWSDDFNGAAGTLPGSD